MNFLHYIYKYLGWIYTKVREKNYYIWGKINSRMYMYAFAECGVGLRVSGNPVIHTPNKIHIGKNFSINNNCQLCPHAEIFIGDNVTMSRGSQITSGGLDTSVWIQMRLVNRVPHKSEEVFIGDGTWLCVNSVVLPGVRITGKGVIVAAGSVVTKDITEDYVVVGGVPAKIIKRLESQD